MRADVLVLNKVDTACAEAVDELLETAKRYNPDATIVLTSSAISVRNPDEIAGKRALVIEDGPTVTHGGMAYGAGALAARTYGAAEIVDPRPKAVGTIRKAFEENPHLTEVLPAIGYSKQQLADLEATIAATSCDIVITGTPVDLSRILHIEKPIVRVTYAIENAGSPTLADVLDEFLATRGFASGV